MKLFGGDFFQDKMLFSQLFTYELGKTQGKTNEEGADLLLNTVQK